MPFLQGVTGECVTGAAALIGQHRDLVHQVCGRSDLEIGWGYVKQVGIVVMTARLVAGAFGWVKAGTMRGRCDESAVGEASGAALSVGCPGGTA